ncbi:kinetochore protein NDC80,putative [Plasmodium sp. gorilla clade G2]|uniref:kinetochore protein NDC80,putative n=1 Tax=Plasmodium sp. gorilla clade G2 TaxID=880535 RepID=UPI000D1FF00D|nr:kinetochore protein NDC80,putative [Plasmodium sp. gorilla clade G2]SOV12576.1 kinetochore protein NDC80,putative [Plasmodium sp. gorilla clade G2]
MNNHSVYNKFNPTHSVFNNNTNLNNSIYVSGDKKSKSRTSLNNLSFYKPNASVYVKKVDKSDKKDYVKTLVRYLGWKNYGGGIIPNLYKNPSMTELINIWNFIFKHVDPLIEVNKDNYGEVVLSFYKDIGYPYTISKSTLVAPTTGLQYNTHLTALAWLCQLLIFEVECNNDINDEKDLSLSYDFNELNEIKMDDFIQHSYKSYINKEDKNLNDMLRTNLEKEIDRLDNDLNNKIEDINEKKKKIEEIKNHMKENEELIKRNKVLCEENQKIKQLYTNSLDETTKLERDIELCKISNQDEKNKMEKILEEIKKVKDILQKQTLNKAQFVQMNENIDKNKEKIEQIKNDIKSLNNEYPNLSEKLNNRNNDLKKIAKTINDKFIEIVENINLYKNISTSDWNEIHSININIDSFTIDNMLNTNWKNYKGNIKNFIDQDEQELKNSLNLIEENEKQIKIIEQDIQSLKKEIMEKENFFKKLNDDTNEFVNKSTQTLNQLVAENEKMLAEAEEKLNETNEMFNKVRASREQKEDEVEKIKEENEKKFKEKLSVLQKACAVLIELKKYSKSYISIVLEEKKKDLDLYKDLQKSLVE